MKVIKLQQTLKHYLNNEQYAIEMLIKHGTLHPITMY